MLKAQLAQSFSSFQIASVDVADFAAATSADEEFSEGYAVCDVIREVDVPRGLLVVVGRREVIEDSITFSAFVEVHQLASMYEGWAMCIVSFVVRVIVLCNAC